MSRLTGAHNARKRELVIRKWLAVEIGDAPFRIIIGEVGNFAFRLLKEENAGNMVGICGNKLVCLPLEKVVKEKKDVDIELYRLASILAT